MERRSRRSKLVTGLVLLAVGIALVAWAFTGRGANAPSDERATTTTNNQQNSDEDLESNEESETATIIFTNDGFSPEELEVRVGTVVTVQNNSDSQVQFSSDDHPTHRLNPEMNLRTLAPGESANFTARTVGTHGFHDHIDATQTGTLNVVE